MVRRIILALGIMLTTVVVLAVAVMGLVYVYMQTPGEQITSRVLIFPKGTAVTLFVDRMAENGVIDHPLLFRLGLKLFYKNVAFQAGEYEFPGKSKPQEVIRRLSLGVRVVRKFTIPEGYTNYQILQKLHSTNGLFGIINTSATEGTLLPQTYLFSYGDEKQAIIDQMQIRFQETMEELWANRSHNLPFNSPEEAVTLASIVEKETGRSEERPLIAGVFINRLRKGMALQTDPTIIYALSQGKGFLDRTLNRKDWKVDSPYNTYSYTGLPPGPIANPGRDAIIAVLHPYETDALFFVADGKGGHHFSATLAEHNKYVKELQDMRKENRKDSK